MSTNELLPASMSIPEAARLVGISPTAMRRAVAKGQIPVVEVSGRIRVLRVPLERMFGIGRGPE